VINKLGATNEHTKRVKQRVLLITNELKEFEEGAGEEEGG
jgi:hypothetical protein